MILKPKPYKSRILYYKNGRAYHLCTVQFKPDLSVYIFPPSGSKITKGFPITIAPNNRPLKGIEEDLKANDFHFSYHTSTGYKHIKSKDFSNRLATYNTNQGLSEKVLFERLIRIIPRNPQYLPFIPVARKSDVLIDSKINNNKPISLFFCAFSGYKDPIEMDGPPGSTFYLITSFGHITIGCTVLPLMKNNIYQEEWVEETIWTTPY